ncbi:hypothetical protein J2T15_003686 [Paenibacillus harenae]|uniref:Uncharacterized protein n=1 Tax=Paenibacillus harenae TaxID=306543 RepID=A0ABT9U3L0_PAEHA|nr:hypothetical protein [Paenibacillus harenae]
MLLPHRELGSNGCHIPYLAEKGMFYNLTVVADLIFTFCRDMSPFHTYKVSQFR